MSEEPIENTDFVISNEFDEIGPGDASEAEPAPKTEEEEK